MTPLVSILIPAYNSAPWLTTAIESALAQTWPRKEVIVVDDASRDGTVQVARRFGDSIRLVIHPENRGAAGARNTAYQHCEGDYIQWLDGDDALAPDKVAIQMEAATRFGPKKLLSSAWGHFFSNTHRTRFYPTVLWRDLTPIEWLIGKMSHNLHMQPASWLVSRSLTEAAGPWDTRLTMDDDGEYFCRVLLASEGTHFSPNARTYYRMTGLHRLSNAAGSSKKLESLWLSMQLHIKYLLSLREDAETRAVACRYLQNWMIEFYPWRLDLVNEARKLAAQLGGELTEPELPWKYAWIQKTFGWGAAKSAQSFYNQIKTGLTKATETLKLTGTQTVCSNEVSLAGKH